MKFGSKLLKMGGKTGCICAPEGSKRGKIPQKCEIFSHFWGILPLFPLHMRRQMKQRTPIAMGGFANALLPALVQAPDMAYPRANNASLPSSGARVQPPTRDSLSEEGVGSGWTLLYECACCFRHSRGRPLRGRTLRQPTAWVWRRVRESPFARIPRVWDPDLDEIRAPQRGIRPWDVISDHLPRARWALGRSQGGKWGRKL